MRSFEEDVTPSRISCCESPNEWPVTLAERWPYLDPDSETRVPAPAVPQGGLDEPERRVGLRLRRFGRRTRRRLAEYHPGGVAYGRFALRPPNSRPVLLPIEALRNRGDCLPRRRLVRTHLRLPVSGSRASPAPLRRCRLPRDGLGEWRAGSLSRGRPHAVLRRRDARPHGRRERPGSAGRRPQPGRNHPPRQAVLEREVRGDLLHQDDGDLADGLARAGKPQPNRHPPVDP